MNESGQVVRIVVCLLLVACTVAPVSETAQPTQAQSAVPSDAPTPRATTSVPAVSPSSTPSATPTQMASPNAASPSPEPTATPTSVPTNDAGVWTVNDNFPPAGVTVTAARPRGGFVAGGWIDEPTADCPEQRRAVIWSTHGDDWSESLLERPSDATIIDFIESDYGFGGNAIGNDGSYDCGETGIAVWSETDKSDWYRLPDAPGFPTDGEIVDAVAVAGEIVVSGWHSGDDSTMGIWISAGTPWPGDLERWRLARKRPPTRLGTSLTKLAALGNVVVGLDSERATPVWFSHDGGDTWSNSSYRPSYRLTPTSVAANDERIVVVGSACCAAPGEAVGVAIWSDDGETWHESDPPAFVEVPSVVLATPTGFVALGRETYVSEDGASWRIGPRLPGYRRDDRLVAAVNDQTFLAIGERASWTTPAHELVAGKADPPAAMPSRQHVGDSFDYGLHTHCGAPIIYFDLRTWVVDPRDLDGGQLPSSYGDPGEPGILEYVERDRLVFTNGSGDALSYLPADPTPDPDFCA